MFFGRYGPELPIIRRGKTQVWTETIKPQAERLSGPEGIIKTNLMN